MLIFILFAIFQSITPNCTIVQRCPCINASSTLLCTQASCQSVFFPTTLKYSYNHLVFTSDQGCKPCPFNCQICNSQINCIQCENQYYLSNGICNSCSVINCNICDNQTCSTCKSGYYLDQTSGLCLKCPINGTLTCPSVSTISSCITSYYLSNDGANCIQCDPNCLMCLSATNCGTCNQGYYISLYKCQICNLNCLSCQNSSACTSCSSGLYLNTTNLCQQCNTTFPNCFNCTFSNCTVCMSGYYISATKTCLIATTIINNCLVYGSSSACSICNLGYFLNSTSGICIYGCSNLCSNCSGPHFGLCYSCNSNSVLFNMNCLPTYNINGGVQYQILVTPRNSFSGFNPVNTVYCLQTSIGYLSSINYTLNNLSGFRIMVLWKIYMFGVLNSSSYNVTLNKIGVFLSKNISNAQNICINIAGLQYIQKNSTNFTNIAATNVLTFTAKSTEILSISQIILIVARCGGLYGTNCLVCSSFNNCTACKNISYYIFGADCVSQCPSNYYTYSALMTCYQTCPIGSYNINYNLTCVACPTACTSCTNGTYCNTCSKGYFLDSTRGNCSLVCPLRYYGNNATNTCNDCIYPCLTCTSDVACVTCYFGFLYDITSSCVNICPDGYYGDLTINKCLSCKSITFHCSTCLNSLQNCLSCDNVNPYILNSICYNICPEGYYGSNFSCNLCDPVCSICSVISTNCTKCNYGYLYNFNCLSVCPNGYYGRSFNLTCQLCDMKCATCLYNSTYCLSCSTGYFYIKQISDCQLACPTTYYSQNFTCIKCVLPCLACTSITNCLSCKSIYLYQTNCVQSQYCPSTTFPNPANFTCTFCNPTNLSSGCLTCSSLQNCTSCNLNYSLYNYTCLINCPNIYYSLNQICIQCVNPCLQCSNQTVCISCRSGYFFVPYNNYCTINCSIGFYSFNSTCLLCNSSCASCTSLLNCSICALSNYLNPPDNLGNSGCLPTCPIGYFPYNLYCFKCLLPCLTCLDQTRCLSCNSTYGIQYQYQCISTCIAGTFNYLNITCQLCLSPCVTCIGTATNCTSCVLLNNTLLYLQNGSCVNNCTDGFFQNQILDACSVCSTTCKTCKINQTYCTSCNTGFLYQGSCIIFCPNLMYAENNICKACLNPCITCSSSTICLTCISKYYLNIETSTCILNCNQTSYGSYSQLCQSCVYPCRRCVDSLNCLSCLYGSYYKNQCLQVCPSGTFTTTNISEQNLLICQSCSPVCSSCRNLTICLNCMNTSLFLINGSCLEICPIGYYGDVTGQCFPCKKTCSSCSNGYSCNICSQGFLFNSQCVTICPMGYVISGNTCLLCTNNCLICASQSSICLSCLQNYYLYLSNCIGQCPYGTFKFSQNQTCISCKQPCQSCKDQYSCETCMYGYILYRGIDNNQCVVGPFCPNSYYLNIDIYECVMLNQCPISYLKEYSNRTCSEKCAGELVAFYLNNTCLLTCPDGFWVNSDLICQLINPQTPKLPNFNCRFHIYRNLFIIICNLNTISYQILTLTQANFSLSINGTFNLLHLSQSQISILFFPSQEKIFNRQVSLNFFSKYGIRQQNSNIPIQTNPIVFDVDSFFTYSSSNRQIGMYMYQISSSLSAAAIIFWLAGLFRNRGMQSVRLLDIFQNVFLLYFLNTNYAPNIGQFLQGFKFSFFSFLPVIQKIQIDKQNSLQKFYILMNGVSFIRNFLPCFIIIIVFVSVFCLLYAIKKILDKIKQNSNKLEENQKESKDEQKEEKMKILQKIQKLQKKIQILIYRFQLDYVNDCLYVITLPIFSLWFAQITLVTNTLSYISLLLGSIFVISIIIFTLSAIYVEYQQKDRKKLCWFQFCVRGFNMESAYSKYHISFLFIQKIIKSLILIQGYYHPAFTLGCFMIISSCNIAIYIYQQPYAIKMTNYFNLTQQILFIILNITIAASILGDSFQASKLIILGWISCIIIIIIILLAFIHSSAHILLYQWFQWQQNKIAEEKKQQSNSKIQKGEQQTEQSNMHKIRTFFSKGKIEGTNTSFSSDVNVIKKDYLFEEDSEKSQGLQQIPKILIKCIKPGYPGGQQWKGQDQQDQVLRKSSTIQI